MGRKASALARRSRGVFLPQEPMGWALVTCDRLALTKKAPAGATGAGAQGQQGGNGDSLRCPTSPTPEGRWRFRSRDARAETCRQKARPSGDERAGAQGGAGTFVPQAQRLRPLARLRASGAPPFQENSRNARLPDFKTVGLKPAEAITAWASHSGLPPAVPQPRPRPAMAPPAAPAVVVRASRRAPASPATS
jgi:hypothetical protein